MESLVVDGEKSTKAQGLRQQWIPEVKYEGRGRHHHETTSMLQYLPLLEQWMGGLSI